MKYDARVNLKIEEPEGSERNQGIGAANQEDAAPAQPYERDTTVDDVINDLKANQ
jgi:hypothetical protein